MFSSEPSTSFVFEAAETTILAILHTNIRQDLHRQNSRVLSGKTRLKSSWTCSDYSECWCQVYVCRGTIFCVRSLINKMLHIGFPHYTSLPDIHTKECSHIYVLIQSACSNLQSISYRLTACQDGNTTTNCEHIVIMERTRRGHTQSLTPTNPHLNKVQMDDEPLIHFLCIEKYPNVSP